MTHILVQIVNTVGYLTHDVNRGNMSVSLTVCPSLLFNGVSHTFLILSVVAAVNRGIRSRKWGDHQKKDPEWDTECTETFVSTTVSESETSS